jgi:hypothetical protein
MVPHVVKYANVAPFQDIPKGPDNRRAPCRIFCPIRQVLGQLLTDASKVAPPTRCEKPNVFLCGPAFPTQDSPAEGCSSLSIGPSISKATFSSAVTVGD